MLRLLASVLNKLLDAWKIAASVWPPQCLNATSLTVECTMLAGDKHLQCEKTQMKGASACLYPCTGCQALRRPLHCPAAHL